MAALSLVQNALPYVANVTLSGTPNTMQELQIGANTGRIEIVFTDEDGKFLTSGTDAAVIDGQSSIPVPADSSFYFEVPRAKGAFSVFIASASASVVVSILVTGAD